MKTETNAESNKKAKTKVNKLNVKARRVRVRQKGRKQETEGRWNLNFTKLQY